MQLHVVACDTSHVTLFLHFHNVKFCDIALYKIMICIYQYDLQYIKLLPSCGTKYYFLSI